MDEIVPGVFHWTTFHEGIGQTVHSHLHAPSGAVFDPRLPEDGLTALAMTTVPSVVLLSNRHHLRHSAELAEAFEVPVRVHQASGDAFGDEDAPTVGTFAAGDVVADGVVAYGLPALTPEETVFRIEPAGDGDAPVALLFADTVIHRDGQLSYVPDALLGDDPDAVRRAMTNQLAALLEDAAPFDALLFAHGTPIAEGGRERLAAFVASQRDRSLSP